MDGPKVDQATEDIFAYIDSLDASEALGELRHVGAMYQRVADVYMRMGTQPTTVALMLMPVVIALGAQVQSGTGGIVPTPPPHDGSVHTCTLLGRSIQAAMR